NPKTRMRASITKVTGNFELLPTPDGLKAYIVREGNPKEANWTELQQWDLDKAKLIKTEPMKPPSASFRLKLSVDGSAIFLHEYLSQHVYVYNTKTTTAIADVGPTGGGCATFDITPD